MKDDHIYDGDVAGYYSLYRPPYHDLILKKALTAKSFDKGLDIGCGLGHSSVALAQYCNQVVAIDPNVDMLESAIQHQKVTYEHTVNFTAIEEKTFDVITFAGSLYYAKSDDLIDQLSRITKDKSVIVVYDFKIHLDLILDRLRSQTPEGKSSYDHSINFSDQHSNGLTELKCFTEQFEDKIDVKNICALILSEKKHQEYFNHRYKNKGVFQSLVNEVVQLGYQESIEIIADLYCTTYRIN